MITFLYVLFACALTYGQVVITEVMYDLPGTDSPNEFIEIFNLSPSDSADLAGWHIKDKYSTDELLESGYGMILPPQSYGLIFEGDYDFSSGIYSPLILDSVILIKVDDLSIGNGLSTSDSLYLIDRDTLTVDSLGWEDIAPDGFSIERVRLYLANTGLNWLASKDSLGTPGAPNSIRPLALDAQLARDNLYIQPAIIEQNQTAMVFITVINNGIESLSGTVEVIWQEVILEQAPFSGLDELDTLALEISVGPFTAGNQELRVNINVIGDLDIANNDGLVTLGVRYSRGILAINEFMPQPVSDQVEFVEFVHLGNESVNLHQWRLADNRSGTNYHLPVMTLQPEEYLVVAVDSSLLPALPFSAQFIVPVSGFPTLNNGGDAIRLFDPFDTLIDSLSYTISWGIQSGASMEKIFPHYLSADSLNWASCNAPGGMTPGAENSVTPLILDGAFIADQIIFNPHYPKPDESVMVLIPVTNQGATTFSANVLLIIADNIIGSAPVMSIAPSETTAVELSLPPFESGIHPLLVRLDLPGDLDYSDNEVTDTLRVSYEFGVIQLNEFMARPNNDQTEFVELVSMINCKMSGWSITDNTKTHRVIPDIQVGSGDYFVIAADSSIVSSAPNNTNILIPLNGFPVLNNSGDAIYLFDMTGQIIDSLIYDSAWPLAAELSCEKLRPEFNSNNSQNWQLAVASGSMTPGWRNSVALFDLDGTIWRESIRHEPAFPKPDENTIVIVPVINLGVSPISGVLTIEEADEELASVSVPTIAIADTINVSVPVPSLTSGSHPLTLLLDIPGDDNPYNDIAQDTLFVSYNFETLIMNEFLAIPDSTQSEFIELFCPVALNLNNWAISDNSRQPKRLPDLQVPDNGYIVIAADSNLLTMVPEATYYCIPDGGFPALNNTKDAIFLFDMTGSIIDSLVYDESWPVMTGRSTEKFRPEYNSNDRTRWAVAVSREALTPGATNSIFYEALPKTGMVTCTPNPFSPDNDGKDDRLNIQYKLPFEQGILKIQIFDMVGRTIATPLWNVYVPQEGLFTWDGKRSNGKTARIGIYLIRIIAKDPSSGKEWEDLKTVVLAKKL